MTIHIHITEVGMRYISLLILLLLLTSSMHAQVTVQPNSVANGKCNSDREWFCNLEFDTEGNLSCMSGMTCNGIFYSTCPSTEEKNASSNIESSFSISDDRVEVKVSKGIAIITIHDVRTGQTVHDFGTLSTSTLVPTASINRGLYVIVTRDAETGIVVESKKLMVE